ncbi:MAG: Na(+)/H(+) antiporter subunit D [bacterium]|nr:Na(+)/H(+) antiporter subunit D [bacterium]
MSLGSIWFPLVMALLAFGLPSNRWRPWLLPASGLAHLLFFALGITAERVPADSHWLALDPLGKLVLGLISVLFLPCSFYAAGYLNRRGERSNRIFCSCLLVFLAMMSLVCWSQHLGLLWVAIDATTLASGPLIYFNRTPRSIEAAWKYLMVCSVGIALALLGSLFLAYASLHGGEESSLIFGDLLLHAPQLSKPWVHAGFVLLLVGYGTKMGLAPMHTWKPDAYGEAPGVVGALLAGGLANCAFLAILRVHQVCIAAGEGEYASRLLLFVALLSMACAAVFMVGQKDFKRMLAYSSIEHMGILALGVGVGGLGAQGALLHMVNNGLTKGVLFLSAGNLHRAYGDKTTDAVRGALIRSPLSGWLFLLGFLAITGSPPFAPFVSEFSILRSMVESGRHLPAAAFLAFLLVIFVGMGKTVLSVVQGNPPEGADQAGEREGVFTSLPIVMLMGAVLMLGVWIPEPLSSLVDSAARFLELKS